MTLIVKAASLALVAGEDVEVLARSYKGARLEIGSDAYIWLSETQGGDGLAARARLVGVLPAIGGMLLRLNVERLCEGSGMRNADLRPYRDVNDGTARHQLADKLYRYAHNKVAEITPAEVELLEAVL